jgi:hypothetical protein
MSQQEVWLSIVSVSSSIFMKHSFSLGFIDPLFTIWFNALLLRKHGIGEICFFI